MNDAEDAVILATAQSAEILPERLQKFLQSVLSVSLEKKSLQKL